MAAPEPLTIYEQLDKGAEMFSGTVFAAADISASGLQAERMRMEVAASNIANSHATRSPFGGPYRRQQVLFAPQSLSSFPRLGHQPQQTSELGGVAVQGLVNDQSPFPKVYNPGHPDADADGFLQMPNVVVPMELVDLMTASRAYEANLKSLETFRRMAQQTLSLMRGVAS